MNPLRLSVRFPVTSAPDDLEPAIAVFHRFIQRGLVEGLVLDVADYRHVPGGPGVMLIGHDVDYGVTGEAFTVVRKRAQHDDAATQLRDALRLALGAIDALESDGELAVSIDRSQFSVIVADRSLGASSDVGAQLLAEVEPVAASLLGGGAAVTVVASDDPRDAPTVRVAGEAAAAGAMLEALGGARAPGQSPWDITVEDLVQLRSGGDDFILLDVREQSEYDIVNLGGRLAPVASLGDHLDGIASDARVVVHCRAGIRGSAAVAEMREAGFTDVWNVNGGLMAWVDRIDPSLPRY